MDRKKVKWLGFFLWIALLVPGLSGKQEKSMAAKNGIDPRSFNLGVIAGFAEMVDTGVKKLALSAPLPPVEMEALMDEAKQIALRNHTEIFREKDFMVTDLFPEDVARGMDVLLIYKGSTLDEYLALKKKKTELLKTDRYEGAAREEIARSFGRLLSYPAEKIQAMLRTRTAEYKP